VHGAPQTTELSYFKHFRIFLTLKEYPSC